ncbi:MAG: site-2 protease family protein [Mycobacteriales bacterium]
MREHVRLGRIAGIPIGMNLSVLVIFVLVVELVATQALPGAVKGYSTGAYYGAGVGVGLLFFASLLSHELAHAVVARRYGVKVEKITLWMLGGVAQLAGEPPTPSADLRIAAAGPLTSLAAGAVFFGCAAAGAALGGPDLLTAGFGWLAGINVLLGVFNLLPGAPLDGGRILRGLLWKRSHDRTRAALAADRAGRVLGMGLVGLGLAELLFTTNPIGGIWLMLLGWFLVAAATGEAQATSQHSLLAGLTVRAVMSTDPVVLPSYQVVDAVLGRVLAEQHAAYPVISFEGKPVGLVTTVQLARLPAPLRSERRVADLTIPLSQVPTAGPDEAFADVLDRAGGRLPVLVLERGELIGIISATDTNRLLLRAALSPTPQ